MIKHSIYTSSSLHFYLRNFLIFLNVIYTEQAYCIDYKFKSRLYRTKNKQITAWHIIELIANVILTSFVPFSIWKTINILKTINKW